MTALHQEEQSMFTILTNNSTTPMPVKESSDDQPGAGAHYLPSLYSVASKQQPGGEGGTMANQSEISAAIYNFDNGSTALNKQ